MVAGFGTYALQQLSAGSTFLVRYKYILGTPSEEFEYEIKMNEIDETTKCAFVKFDDLIEVQP